MHSGAGQLSGSDYSLVDYNRAGVPLLEVVSEPDMRSGEEAAAYASELRRIMVFMGITDGVMAEGHLRFDVNVSVSIAILCTNMEVTSNQAQTLCFNCVS